MVIVVHELWIGGDASVDRRLGVLPACRHPEALRNGRVDRPAGVNDRLAQRQRRVDEVSVTCVDQGGLLVRDRERRIPGRGSGGVGMWFAKQVVSFVPSKSESPNREWCGHDVL